MRTSFWFCLVLVLVATPQVAAAGCKSDCLDDYQSEKQSCNLLYDDPDDADSLRMCLDDAKSTYDDCIEECES